MSVALKALVGFLVILNPFALCLYLQEIMNVLGRKDFVLVLLRACIISLLVFWGFALSGERLLVDVLAIKPGAMRAFGGLIFLIIGYNYVAKGYKTAETLRGSMDELPSAISLPFMIGGGTITQSILVGKALSPGMAVTVLLIGVTVSFAVVVAFKTIRDHMRRKDDKVFDRYVNIMVRINGLMIGAISVDMVVSGMAQLWLDATNVT